jgi:hypothetical protein
MAKYNVLRPVEHNEKLYLPKQSQAPGSAKSAGNGHDVAVDSSGTIDLDDSAARALINGQIARVPEEPAPRTDRRTGKR